MSRLSVGSAYLIFVRRMSVRLMLVPLTIVAASFAAASDKESAWRGKQSAVTARPLDREQQPSPALLHRVGNEIRDVVDNHQSTADVPVMPNVPGMTNGFDESNAMQMEKDLRYQRLYDQVRALLDGWEQRQVKPAGNDPVNPSDGDRSIHDDSEPLNPSPPRTDQHGLPNEAVERSLPGQAVDPLRVATAIVDGPIDRLALANNLYATGQLVLALEMYEQIDQSAVSQQDRYWIEYQLACCLRKLRRIPEAQSRFRRLAAQPEAGVLNEMSRWWLDRITDRAALETDIQRLQKIMDTIREAQNVQSRTR